MNTYRRFYVCGFFFLSGYVTRPYVFMSLDRLYLHFKTAGIHTGYPFRGKETTDSVYSFKKVLCLYGYVVHSQTGYLVIKRFLVVCITGSDNRVGVYLKYQLRPVPKFLF